MNVTESTQVYRLLDFVLDQPGADANRARAAAVALADRAHRALAAGPRGEEIAAQWERQFGAAEGGASHG